MLNFKPHGNVKKGKKNGGKKVLNQTPHPVYGKLQKKVHPYPRVAGPLRGGGGLKAGLLRKKELF